MHYTMWKVVGDVEHEERTPYHFFYAESVVSYDVLCGEPCFK